MSKNRYVDTRFWDDTYITTLDPTEKLLFLYFLTNPLTNIAGIYEISFRRISLDTGLEATMIERIVGRFAKDKKVYYKLGHIIVCNFPKYQDFGNSPKIKQGIELILAKLPPKLLYAMDTLSIPYVYSLNYTNYNYNNNNNNNAEVDTVPIATKVATLQELVEPFKEKYPEKLLTEFVTYWTEKNVNGKKERWQMQKVFDPARRLAMWASKDWNLKPKVNSIVEI